DEAVTNIMIHGYRGKAGPVEVGVWHDGQMLVVQVRDKGPPIDPTAAPPPDIYLPQIERPRGGLGKIMMKQSVDDLTYRSLGDGGNELTFRKEV
ncbi:MAG: ATP-binding protein, partial [Anaerolineae bacterium]